MRGQKDLFPKTVYCIDTSSLINLKWPLQMKEVLPTIWNKLENMTRNGELIAPMEVYGEIEEYYRRDEIYYWCTNNKKMFKDVDECQAQKIREIQKHYDKGYWENENNKPKWWADPWVISLGICEKATIVADEKNKPNRIPVISTKLGIRCIGLLDFFKEIGIKY